MNAIPPKSENEKPKSEPKITQTRAPILATRLGRGRLGGSTICDFLVQRARIAGRPVTVADGDLLNPTLAGLYPPGAPGEATRPKSAQPAHVGEWIEDLVHQMMQTRTSAVLDLGGGNSALADLEHDLPLMGFCEEAGVTCLPLYFCGPEKDDFDHIVALHEAGHFRGPRSILFFNESLMRAGQTAVEAFGPILRRPEMADMTRQGVKIVHIPRLSCLTSMRATGLSFHDAASNKPDRNGQPMPPMRQFMVKTWMRRMEEAFVEDGVAEWLP